MTEPINRPDAETHYVCPDGCGLPVPSGRKYATRNCWSRTPEGRQKLRATVARTRLDPEYRKKQADSTRTPEHKKLMSETMRRTLSIHPGLASRAGTISSQMNPDRIGMLSELLRRPEQRERQRNVMQRVRSEHPDMSKKGGLTAVRTGLLWKAQAAQERPMSKLENRVFNVILTNELQYDFVGDVRTSTNHIGHKFPDFMHADGKRIVAEVADEGDKRRRSNFQSKADYERYCIENYAPEGWDCIVIWSDMSDEEMVSRLS